MTGSVAKEIKQQAIEELEKISDEAVLLMKSFCPQGGKPWSTGKLKASIHKESGGELVRLVGTDVRGENGFPYARSVDQGRKEVKPQNFYFKGEDKPRLYLKGYNVWLRPGQAAGPAPAQKFVERTKEALESR